MNPLRPRRAWPGDPGDRASSAWPTRCRWRARCWPAASRCWRSRCARRWRWTACAPLRRRCPRPSSAPAPSARWTTRAPRSTPAAASASAPATAATSASPAGDIGLPLLPGVATASEVMAANADGYRFLKFFPATAAGGIPMLKALAGPFADVRVLPHRRHHARDRAAVPGAAQRQGLRRLVADAAGRGGRAGLGAHHRAGARGAARCAAEGESLAAHQRRQPPAPARCGHASSPAATPARSLALRFWLTFHLPCMRVTSISMPTMARSICST